jgi:hypothetical protein
MIVAIILGIVAGILGRTVWRHFSSESSSSRMEVTVKMPEMKMPEILPHGRKHGFKRVEHRFKRFEPAVSLLRRGASTSGGRLRRGWSNRTRVGEALPRVAERAGRLAGHRR